MSKMSTKKGSSWNWKLGSHKQFEYDCLLPEVFQRSYHLRRDNKNVRIQEKRCLTNLTQMCCPDGDSFHRLLHKPYLSYYIRCVRWGCNKILQGSKCLTKWIALKNKSQAAPWIFLIICDHKHNLKLIHQLISFSFICCSFSLYLPLVQFSPACSSHPHQGRT